MFLKTCLLLCMSVPLAAWATIHLEAGENLNRYEELFYYKDINLKLDCETSSKGSIQFNDWVFTTLDYRYEIDRPYSATGYSNATSAGASRVYLHLNDPLKYGVYGIGADKPDGRYVWVTIKSSYTDGDKRKVLKEGETVCEDSEHCLYKLDLRSANGITLIQESPKISTQGISGRSYETKASCVLKVNQVPQMAESIYDLPANADFKYGEALSEIYVLPLKYFLAQTTLNEMISVQVEVNCVPGTCTASIFNRSKTFPDPSGHWHYFFKNILGVNNARVGFEDEVRVIVDIKSKGKGVAEYNLERTLKRDGVTRDIQSGQSIPVQNITGFLTQSFLQKNPNLSKLDLRTQCKEIRKDDWSCELNYRTSFMSEEVLTLHIVKEDALGLVNQLKSRGGFQRYYQPASNLGRNPEVEYYYSRVMCDDLSQPRKSCTVVPML